MSEEEADAIVQAIDIIATNRAQEMVFVHTNQNKDGVEAERAASEAMRLLKIILMKEDS